MPGKFDVERYNADAIEGRGKPLTYGGIAPQGIVAVTNCITPGCESKCGVYRPDYKPVSIERAKELATLAGWVNVEPLKWICERCAQKIAKQSNKKSRKRAE